MSVSCTETYVSVGCTASPGSADWGPNNIVAFGTARHVALAHLLGSERRGVFCMLPGHKARVNCVRWMYDPKVFHKDKEQILIVSGSSDGQLKIWKSQASEWSVEQTLVAHTEPITNICCFQQGQRHIIATTCADGTVKVFTKDPKAQDGGDEGLLWEQIDTLSFGSGLPLAVAVNILPGTQTYILAIGREDNHIHIYIQKENKFHQCVTLAGHTDWIRSLSFVAPDTGGLLLGSGSQDANIRIWKFSQKEVADEEKKPENLSFREKALRKTRMLFKVMESDAKYIFEANLEALLVGHDNWVYSVRWHPSINGKQPCVLLSASMDRTLIIWKPDPTSGIWLDTVRVGDIGGNYSQGFLGGAFSPNGHAILAQGFQGAFFLWQADGSGSQDSESTLPERMEAMPATTGHFGAVRDIAWDPSGTYLLSVSVDQTTRLHTTCNSQGTNTWHEMGRPQVHGHDMRCVSCVSSSNFVSGANEKIIRTFEAPGSFYQIIESLAGLPVELLQEVLKSKPTKPVGAGIPALSLSNKAVSEGESAVQPSMEQNTFSSADVLIPFSPQNFTDAPLEQQLLQNTLWPETQKLYGHGFEVISVSVSNDKSMIMSTCKATSAEYAAIHVWDAKTWAPLYTLSGHKLTVMRMAFSPTDEWVVSGSRDRQICTFRKSDEGKYELKQCIAKAHDRIIWDVSWSADGKYFASASRDKSIGVWGYTEDSQWARVARAVKLQDSATAIDWAPGEMTTDAYVLAVGFDNGSIVLYGFKPESLEVNELHTVALRHCPALTIHRLLWRPRVSDTQNYQLACCSSDMSVRILTFATSTDA
eukprot:m.28618 g.28618  ORF g.28618 m.28618 type:complete len:817 (-) comp8016_c0_seq1:43-2493(-)